MANRSLRLTVTPGRFSGALLPPRFSFHRLTPMSHRAKALHGRGLPRIVRANEHDGVSQLDFDLAETFEVADSKLGEHGMSPVELTPELLPETR